MKYRFIRLEILGALLRHSSLDRTSIPQLKDVNAGYIYNLGNLIGFVGSIIIAISTTKSAYPLSASTFKHVMQNLFGNTPAVLMTISVAIFFASGKAYERGFECGQGSYGGDILSGVGAMVLGAALVALSDPILAATSGLLHAGGKFGSALAARAIFSNRLAACSHIFRVVVLVSRVPAILLSLVKLSDSATNYHGSAPLALSMVMISCYLLWGYADILLLQTASCSSLRNA